MRGRAWSRYGRVWARPRPCAIENWEHKFACSPWFGGLGRRWVGQLPPQATSWPDRRRSPSWRPRLLQDSPATFTVPRGSKAVLECLQRRSWSICPGCARWRGCSVTATSSLKVQEVGEPHLAVEPTTDDLRWFGVGLRCTRCCPTCACGSASTHAGEKEELPPSNSVVAVFQTDGRGGAGRRGTSLWGPRIPACRAACSGDLRRL